MKVLIASSDELFVSESERSRGKNKALLVEYINNKWPYTVGPVVVVVVATSVVGISVNHDNGWERNVVVAQYGSKRCSIRNVP